MTAATGHQDARIELLVGRLLQAGVSLAAAVVSLGAIVYLVKHGSEQIDYKMFHAQPLELRTLTGVMREAAAFDGGAIIQLGMLLLIATPILRVASAAYGFARQGNRRYVAITSAVLGILSYGLLASK